MRAKTPCFLKSTAASANRELHSKKYRRSLASSAQTADYNQLGRRLSENVRRALQEPASDFFAVAYDLLLDRQLDGRGVS